MQPIEGSLLTLAHAVADGDGIDWELAEASAQSPDERDAIAQLRRLATVGVAARAMASHWGPLEIRSEIGSGTFGTVYRAWDKRLEREVALKLLNGEHGERQLASTVVKEGRLLAQIRHPNVVTVFGADAPDGRVGLWMEFVTGRTLKDIVVGQGPFGPHEAAVIGRDLCRALAAVHHQGFVHRDIKAQNVMREAGGRTVLMDFGAGGVANAEPGADGALAGTPAYLAPEVLAGRSPSIKSDLYSLGVLLYYMVSGEFPVTAGSLAELRELHLQHRHTLLRDVRPDLPSAFLRVVDQATVADPAGRPESAGAMEQLIEVALRTRGPNDSSTIATKAGSAGAPVPAGGRFARYRGVAYAAVAVAAVVGALAALERGTWPFEAWRPVRRSSVAVVQFRNLTENRANDFFSMGIADDIAANLAGLGGLRVIPVSVAGSREKSATELAAELGVDTVLDGSVRWSDRDRVRVVSRLVDGRSAETLWSETFDRKIGDVDTSVLSLQSEVSRKIAVTLKGELSEAEARQFASSSLRDAARSHYLAGRHYWSLRNEEGFRRSIAAYQNALKLVPTYAPAYSGLADSYTLEAALDLVPRAAAYAEARKAASKAIELDGSLAEARASLGYVLKNEFQWDAAEKSFRRAIELKPGFGTAHHWYAILLTQRGRFQEAIGELKVAISLDPTSIAAQGQFAATLELARRYDEAIEQAERTIAVDPLHPTPYLVMAEAYAYKKDYERALAAMGRWTKAAPLGGGDQIAQANIGFIHAMAGRRAKAEVILEALEVRERAGDALDGAIATIYGALGNKDRAFRFLTRSQIRGESDLGYLKVDPRWDPLREDPRFDALLKSIGLVQ